MHQPYEEAFYETEAARLRRWLPWLHLFRGFRLATRWQNLFLAAVGLVLLTAGRWGLSLLPWPPDAATAIAAKLALPWERQFLAPPLPTPGELAAGQTPFRPWTLLAPAFDLLRPGRELFVRRAPWDRWLLAGAQVLLVLAVGAWIGGAISRRVASEFTGHGEPGVRDALATSCESFVDALTAPLIAVVGMGMLLAAGRIIAWIGRLPAAGEAVAAALWGLLLLLSLVLALMLLGVAAGWALMVVARNVERTDGFDALNRACNYVFVRPWYSSGMLLVVLAYGSLLVLFLTGLIGLTLHLSGWIAAGPLPDEALARITADAPALARPLEDIGAPTGESFSRRLGGVWHRGLALALTAFVYSYFWTSATLMYLLLRKSVDAADLDQLAVPRPPRPPSEPPLAGIPAVERRETLRDREGTVASPNATQPTNQPPTN